MFSRSVLKHLSSFKRFTQFRKKVLGKSKSNMSAEKNTLFYNQNYNKLVQTRLVSRKNYEINHQLDRVPIYMKITINTITKIQKPSNDSNFSG